MLCAAPQLRSSSQHTDLSRQQLTHQAQRTRQNRSAMAQAVTRVQLPPLQPLHLPPLVPGSQQAALGANAVVPNMGLNPPGSNSQPSPAMIPPGTVTGTLLPRPISKTTTDPGCAECFSCLPWSRHPFFDAVEEGDAERVGRMARSDISLVRCVDARNRLSAWHIAAERGHVEVLRSLVDAVLGCSESHHRLNSSLRRMLMLGRSAEALVRHFLNWKAGGGSLGGPPLVLAARAGRHETVDYLLGMGANPWLPDARGLSALHHAAACNQCEVIHELLKQPPPFSNRACRWNTPTTKYVDVCDPYGLTPLHHATLAGQAPALSTLLSHDANLIARTILPHPTYSWWPAGLSALHIASWNGSMALVKLLLLAYYESAADLLPSATAMLETAERRRRQRSHPDPRLILTRSARLPYHYAHRQGQTELLEWLDPSIPLMFLFAGTDSASTVAGAPGVTVGVPRLSLLAARALHECLLDQLDAADTALKAAAAHAEAAAVMAAAKAQEVADHDRMEKKKERKGLLASSQRRRHNAVSDSGAASVMNTPARVLSAVLGRGGGNVGGGGDGRGAPYRHRPSSATGSGATVRPESGDPSRRGSRDEVSVGTGRRRGSLNFTLGDNGNNGRSLLSRITGRGKRGDGGGGSVNEGELLRMGVTIPRDVDRDHVATVARATPQALRPTLAIGPGGVLTAATVTPQPTTTPDHSPLPTGTFFLTAQPPSPLAGDGSPGVPGGTPPSARARPRTLSPLHEAACGNEVRGVGNSVGPSPLGLDPSRTAGIASILAVAAAAGVAGAAPESGCAGGMRVQGGRGVGARRALVLDSPRQEGTDGPGAAAHQNGSSAATPGDREDGLGLPSPHSAWLGADAAHAQAPAGADPKSDAEGPPAEELNGAASTPEKLTLPGAALSVPVTPLTAGTAIAAVPAAQNSGSECGSTGSASSAPHNGVVTDATPVRHSKRLGSSRNPLAAAAPLSLDGVAHLQLPGHSHAHIDGAGTGDKAGDGPDRCCCAPTSPSHGSSLRRSYSAGSLSRHTDGERAGEGGCEGSRAAGSPQAGHPPLLPSHSQPDVGGGGPGARGPRASHNRHNHHNCHVTIPEVGGDEAVPEAGSGGAPGTGTPRGSGLIGATRVTGGGGGLLASLRSHLRTVSNQVAPALSPFRRSRHEISDTLAGGAAVGGGPAPGVPSEPLPGTLPSKVKKADAAAAGAKCDGADEDDSCPVCLDHVPNIQLAGCGHKLCVVCARDLCKRHNLTPALCPYCRHVIRGFKALTNVLPAPADTSS